jgi:hypothetical protein
VVVEVIVVSDDGDDDDDDDGDSLSAISLVCNSFLTAVFI